MAKQAKPKQRYRCSLVGLAALVLSACVSQPASRLASVKSWASQLQGVERPGAVAKLCRARVDLVVIEATRSVRGNESFDLLGTVARIRTSRGDQRAFKLCAAYLNVGQAEDYRDYWTNAWQKPTATSTGQPDFVLSLDPDGWPGNYPVAFWDPRWQRVLFGHENALLDRAIAAGFDGVYLDWILAWSDKHVLAAARAAKVDPAKAMVELLLAMRAYARERKPRFFLIAQNGAWLGDSDPRFFQAIDGFAQEDVWFRGEAGNDWNSPKSGDIAAKRKRVAGKDVLVAQLESIVSRGVPVLTIDYALDPANIDKAYRESRRAGFVPFVSRTPLDRLPAFPGR